MANTEELNSVEKYQSVKDYILKCQSISELKIILLQVHDNHNKDYKMTEEIFDEFIKKQSHE